MANFTTGTIDLSANNTFDNVVMGPGDVMNFSNAGTGGAAGAPILVTGNFTMTGGTITLRRANLSPGSVTAGGITKNLNTVPGANGNGGTGGRAGGQFVYAMGGSGGQGGSEGNDAYYYDGSVHYKANSHGAYPGGAGSTVDTYGGGGGGGKTGESNEAVCFYVLGNVSITGGTIQGAGENGGNGGPGGNGNGSPAGGGGGGGGGGSGGRLFIIHVGTQTESGVTKSLAAGSGGSGGAKGTGYYDSYDSAAGSAGTAGTAGYVEYTKADTTPEIGTLSVTAMFENQINGICSIANNGGHDITEMGFVTGANANPTTSDTKHTVTAIQSGSFSKTITGLTASTHYHVRAFATNSKGTVYSNDLSFTTLEVFFSKSHLCS